MRVGADDELGGVDAAGVERGHLAQQDLGIDDDAVADDRHDRRGEDAAGEQMEGELLVADDNGVPSVVAALVAHDVVDAPPEEIGRLALALIAPLGTEENYCWHVEKS